MLPSPRQAGPVHRRISGRGSCARHLIGGVGPADHGDAWGLSPHLMVVGVTSFVLQEAETSCRSRTTLCAAARFDGPGAGVPGRAASNRRDGL